MLLATALMPVLEHLLVVCELSFMLRGAILHINCHFGLLLLRPLQLLNQLTAFPDAIHSAVGVSPQLVSLHELSDLLL